MKKNLILTVLVLVLVMTTGIASAALTGVKDTLAKTYDADAVLAGADGWNNTGLLGGAAGCGGGTDFYKNGDGNLEYTTNVASGGVWQQQNAAGSYFFDNVGSETSYTVEARIKMEAPMDGTNTTYLWMKNAGGQGLIFEVRDTGTNITGDDTADNTDAFHTFRIAFDAETDDFYFWRDETLLSVGAGNGAGGGKRLIIGDGSSSIISGTVQYEYVAIDATGAYAPVPEPATMILLGLGAISALRRRRKLA